MKTFVSKKSIYFCGKVKDLRTELMQYQSTNITLKELINLKLN